MPLHFTLHDEICCHSVNDGIYVSCRYSLLRLYGNACGFLHKCHQHPGRHQWHRVRSSSVYLRLHHRVQPAGAQWCVVRLSQSVSYNHECVGYSYRCVIIILHSPPFQTESELAGSRNLCTLQFSVVQRFLFKYWACPLWLLVCCASGDYRDDHVFSLYFMIPFFFTTLALFYHNW